MSRVNDRADAIHVPEGKDLSVIWLEGTDFAEGTIEVDVRGRDVLQRSFLGVAFHRQNDKTYDVVSFYAMLTMESAFPWITPDVNPAVRKQAQDLMETDMIPRQRPQIAKFREGVPHPRVIEMPNTRHDCFIHREDDVVREMRTFLAGK